MNCNTKYWFRKLVTKLMASPWQALAMLMSLLSVCQVLAKCLPSTCLGYAYGMPRLCQELTRRLATNEITSRRSRAYVSSFPCS